MLVKHTEGPSYSPEISSHSNTKPVQMQKEDAVTAFLQPPLTRKEWLLRAWNLTQDQSYRSLIFKFIDLINKKIYIYILIISFFNKLVT